LVWGAIGKSKHWKQVDAVITKMNDRYYATYHLSGVKQIAVLENPGFTTYIHEMRIPIWIQEKNPLIAYGKDPAPHTGLKIFSGISCAVIGCIVGGIALKKASLQ
jgi:hypothetical protein